MTTQIIRISDIKFLTDIVINITSLRIILATIINACKIIYIKIQYRSNWFIIISTGRSYGNLSKILRPIGRERHRLFVPSLTVRIRTYGTVDEPINEKQKHK
jgi:hypothetical protein